MKWLDFSLKNARLLAFLYHFVLTISLFPNHSLCIQIQRYFPYFLLWKGILENKYLMYIECNNVAFQPVSEAYTCIVVYSSE